MLDLLVVPQGLDGRVNLSTIVLVTNILDFGRRRLFFFDVLRQGGAAILAVRLHRMISQRFLRPKVLRAESAVKRSDVFVCGLVLIPIVSPR